VFILTQASPPEVIEYVPLTNGEVTDVVAVIVVNAPVAQNKFPPAVVEHPLAGKAPSAAAVATTKASVAILAVLSAVVCVVAVVPFGSAGVPETFAAVPLVFAALFGISPLVKARQLSTPAPPLEGPAIMQFCAPFARPIVIVPFVVNGDPETVSKTEGTEIPTLVIGVP
jgi:hypothetical protein